MESMRHANDLSDNFQFIDMFSLTGKTAKFSGYVPEARLANRHREWVSILFPRAMLRPFVC